VQPRPTTPEGYMLLHGCTVAARESKRENFCFKIIHPSKKVHRGGRMNYDSIILAADNEMLLRTWLGAIETAISIATAEGKLDTLLTPLSVPASPVVEPFLPVADDISDSSESQDVSTPPAHCCRAAFF
jgi:hypothetical protein